MRITRVDYISASYVASTGLLKNYPKPLVVDKKSKRKVERKDTVEIRCSNIRR